MKQKFKNIEEYISAFPLEVQIKLNTIRKIIQENALNAVEGISYGMPVFKLQKKPLVYFAGHTRHIGFYATPTGHQQFAEKLSKYKHGKGSVQFPLNKPIPTDLIAEMVKFRVKEMNSA